MVAIKNKIIVVLAVISLLAIIGFSAHGLFNDSGRSYKKPDENNNVTEAFHTLLISSFPEKTKITLSDDICENASEIITTPFVCNLKTDKINTTFTVRAEDGSQGSSYEFGG